MAYVAGRQFYSFKGGLMGIKIQVDPSRLDAAAAQIEQQTSSYERNYRRLFQEVDAMAMVGREKITRPLCHRYMDLRKIFSKWPH